MVKVQTDCFSIEQICESGQCFRMKKEKNNRYAVVAYGEYLELEQQNELITFYCSREEYHLIWEKYFDIRTHYGKFTESVDKKDVYLRTAVQHGKGIRILKQDLWEIIVSFIISQRNNIKRIRHCVELLCEKFGEEKQSCNHEIYYTFPDAETLANASIEELLACNLGYRSRYVLRTAQMIVNGEMNLHALQQRPYMAARRELLKLSGVGDKVADCVCLFALHHLEAFPVDTHIQQVMNRYYQNGFPMENYQEFAGVIQQYIFYFDLKKIYFAI